MTIAHKPQVYGCRLCGGTFIRGNRVCMVIHPPGTCCHEYDEPFLKTVVDPNPTYFVMPRHFKFKIVDK